LSVLLGDCFPTDQYYMQNPDEIFTKPNCELQVDLQNLLVLEGHVQCAAYEMPIRPDEDSVYFGKMLPELAEERMTKDELGFYHCHDDSDPFHPSSSRFVTPRKSTLQSSTLLMAKTSFLKSLRRLEPSSRCTMVAYSSIKETPIS